MMTMPAERTGAIRWGEELLEQISSDNTLANDMITEAKRIALTHRAPQSLDDWSVSGAMGLPTEAFAWHPSTNDRSASLERR
jgi:hypothetical protein